MKSKKPHKRKAKRAGASPGTLEFTGERKLDHPLLQHIRYSPDLLEKSTWPSGEGDFGTVPGQVTWFDVMGLHDVKLIERIGQHFRIHPLVLEDILHTQQRPKFEEYGNDAFFVLQSLTYDNDTNTVNSEQIAIYFGADFLITFQENADDTFKAVRDRLEVETSRLRNRKSDYLAYALIDNLVDNYFEVLDRFEERMEVLEIGISADPNRRMKENIYHLKFQLLAMRKSVMPLRDAVNKFSRCECSALDESSAIYIRDLFDHVLRIADLVETYRDMLNGIIELYHSELSLRMNNVMQVLTVITTIFVPLTFLAGVYGMNFDHMPELHKPYGYYYLWGVMIIIAALLLFYFKRKKWI